MLEQHSEPSPFLTQREAPYVWVTWLTPLLAGSSNCQWAAWFQANYSFEKPLSDFSDWRVKHGRLVSRRVKELEAEGYKVYVEGENKFTITGKDDIVRVAGQADIVALKEDLIIVEDCKTGKKRDSDVMQVLSYMLLLSAPGGASHCKGKKLEGRLIYGEEIMDIPHAMMDQEFKESFRDMVGLISSSEPARKVPSVRECRFCKISSTYCPERVDTTGETELEDHDLF